MSQLSSFKNKLVSRRRFVGLSAAAFVALPYNARAAIGAITPTKRPLSRAIIGGIDVRERPDPSARHARVLKADEVVRLLGQVEGATLRKHNPVWFQLVDGFAHSSYIQPVDEVTNPPLRSVTESRWAEVSVPSTVLRAAPRPDGAQRGRLYFGGMFRIVSLREGTDKSPWYLISDGNTSDSGMGFAPAGDFRPLAAIDFAPISPQVPLEDKHIKVDLNTQMATAYEGLTQVFRARVATGGIFNTPNGEHNYFTVPGTHRIVRKIAGMRMVGGARGFDYYDLPGISWATFFTSSGIAFHGVYWHNDFGVKRSHGCVNLLPEDAQWIFRWTLPSYSEIERMKRTPRELGFTVEVS